MKYPSFEFDNAVAAGCHGTATADQLDALHELLRSDLDARDEYLVQVELHSRLASLTFPSAPAAAAGRGDTQRARITAARTAWAIAIIVALVFVVWGATYLARSPHDIVKDNGTPQQLAAETPPDASEPGAATGIFLAGETPINVRFAHASGAPVIVGTGRRAPITLGDKIPYADGGDTLHVWNWETSDASRVFKDVRLWEHQRFAVSPDGNWLVWADGNVLNLSTGERRHVDLGGQYHVTVGLERLSRILDMQFAPDGKRLALLVTELDLKESSHPLRSRNLQRSEQIQIVDFPAATLACSFPSGDQWSLRIGFSAAGDTVITKLPAGELRQQIIERSTTTGAAIRSYEPHVEGHAYAISASPDGRRLAVFDGAGALLIWDRTTGELQHRVTEVRHASNSTAIRFSPDSEFIALNAVQHVMIVNASTGRLEKRLLQRKARDFQWSDNGDILTVITGHAFSNGNQFAPKYNVYPSVQHWHWRTETRSVP